MQHLCIVKYEHNKCTVNAHGKYSNWLLDFDHVGLRRVVDNGYGTKGNVASDLQFIFLIICETAELCW